MAAAEWLRTFLAVYRAGSVSAGRRGAACPSRRPASSWPPSSGGWACPSSSRTPQGVEPTRRGRELHAQVADSLDRLEHVLVGTRRWARVATTPTVRFGSSPSSSRLAVLPRIGPDWPALVARFGLRRRDHQPAGARRARRGRDQHHPRSEVADLGADRHQAVRAGRDRPRRRPPSLQGVGRTRRGWWANRGWPTARSCPLTRRFWLSALGRPFAGDLRLVAPDLRAVVAAVGRGSGCSLLPDFACADALERGTVVELHPVADRWPPPSPGSCAPGWPTWTGSSCTDSSPIPGRG